MVQSGFDLDPADPRRREIKAFVLLAAIEPPMRPETMDFSQMEYMCNL
jgi:hypothetical protein